MISIIWRVRKPAIVSVALDTGAGTFRSALNGKWGGEKKVAATGGFFPAASGACCGASLRFNLGERPFKFKDALPKGRGDAKQVVPFVECAAGDHPAVVAALSAGWGACSALTPGLKEAENVDVRGGGDDATLLGLCVLGGPAVGSTVL